MLDVALIGFEALLQLVCPEGREKWRKIALRCDARILTMASNSAPEIQSIHFHFAAIFSVPKK